MSWIMFDHAEGGIDRSRNRPSAKSLRRSRRRRRRRRRKGRRRRR
jgi:hypothetical protein